MCIDIYLRIYTYAYVTLFRLAYLQYMCTYSQICIGLYICIYLHKSIYTFPGNHYLDFVVPENLLYQSDLGFA